jgi:hypothetical protein
MLRGRGQLRTAHQMLADMGADGFAERAWRELLATGKRVRKRTADTPAQLTPGKPTSAGSLATACPIPRSRPSSS